MMNNTTTTINTDNTNNMIKLVNLTPHEVNFVTDNGAKVLDVPASGVVARVSVQTVVVGNCNGIPITKNIYGEVENLPDPQPNVIYIVSYPVAKSVPERNDVVIPNELVRNDNGVIKGCKSLGLV